MKKILILLCVLFVCVRCSLLRPTLKTPMPTVQKEEPKPAKNKNTIKPYNKVITDKAKTDKGLFDIHQIEEKYYYEIPDSLFNREMLMVTRIAKTATGVGFGGGKQNTQVLRWQRKNKLVLLRSVSHEIFAADSLPIHEAVVNSNFEPILYTFPIVATREVEEHQHVVVEITSLFRKDVKPLGISAESRKKYKVSQLDERKSYIDTLRSYPLNIEARHVMTYSASKAPSNKELGTMTVEMNNSMILLPKTPMKRRYADPRVGWFSRSQVDYGLDVQKTKALKYLDRWRLEIKEEDIGRYKNGELVEPKKPIVYYIDRATPEKWKPYIKQGVEDWNIAFEEAGFKNAIRAEDPPTPEEDPEWSPEDVRYSVVRYLASPIPNANGPHVSDPRSGEILESDINWYHNVMTLLRNWFFVQTAAINPEARSVKFKDSIMGELIRFVSAHEVGHTLGLPHNMGSSVAYPTDSLRSPEFTKQYGTAPSIMDYARFNYVAQPEDGDVSLMPGIGPYDKYAIRWGYRPILDATPEEEKEILRGWISEKAGDSIYRFGGQQFSHILDPSSQTEDLGDDAVKSSTYGIANLKRIVPNLAQWTKETGEPYDNLSEMYTQVINQYNRYMGHVTANIGGVYQYTKVYGQEGPVYSHVKRQRQQESLQFLIQNLFQTPEWLLDTSIWNKIEFVGGIERLEAIQKRTLHSLLSFDRLGRLIENEAIHGEEAFTLSMLMAQLRNGIWSELIDEIPIDVYRRNLQRMHVDRLAYLLTKKQLGLVGREIQYSKRNKVTAEWSDIRPIARNELKMLRKDITRQLRRRTDTTTRIHLEDIVERIDDVLNPITVLKT